MQLGCHRTVIVSSVSLQETSKYSDNFQEGFPTDLLSAMRSQACYLPSLPAVNADLLRDSAFTTPYATAAQVLQAEYTRRVGIERGQHDLVCQPIRQRNAERHQAAARRAEQRKHVEKANDELVLAAEQLQQQRLYEVCLA